MTINDQPIITRFELGPFETNCYVLKYPERPECWIIDASYQPADLIDCVRREGLRPSALVLTHAHCDHIAGAFEVVGAFPGLSVWVHETEREWLGDPILNLSALMGLPVTAPEASRLIREGDALELAGRGWRVLHTPGHSPGGITLWSASAGVAISGDALFAGSIGRTDFPGSRFETLARSIREKLYTLPDETRVLPGHGPETTIGREKTSNPFVRP